MHTYVGKNSLLPPDKLLKDILIKIQVNLYSLMKIKRKISQCLFDKTNLSPNYRAMVLAKEPWNAMLSSLWMLTWSLYVHDLHGDLQKTVSPWASCNKSYNPHKNLHIPK